MKDIRRFY